MRQLLRTTVIAAIVDGALAVALSGRSGADSTGMIWANGAVGMLVGAVSALVVSWLIKRFHSLGYVAAVAGFLALLVLTVWFATSTQNIVAAAALAVIVPLYLVAALIAVFTVRPKHRDR